MNFTTLDGLFTTTSKRNPPRAKATRDEYSGIAKAVGKISKRLSSIEKASTTASAPSPQPPQPIIEAPKPIASEPVLPVVKPEEGKPIV